MKKRAFLLSCIIFLILYKIQSQSTPLFQESFTEQTTEQDKFAMYLDSIDKYLYRDVNITTQALEECKNIIGRGTMLSDSILFEYNLVKIYYFHNNLDPLAAYKLILDTENSIPKDKLSKSQKGSLNYIKAYTYMSVGDLEAAQNSYYENMQNGWANNDTITVINSSYSLGQLYSDEKDYDEAIKCFSQNVEFLKTVKSRPSTIALTDFELSEAYVFKKEYDKAIRIIDHALSSYLEKHKMNILKSDFLLLKGHIYLSQNKIDSAQAIYKELQKLEEVGQDMQGLSNNQEFLADLYAAKKMYPEAIRIYERLVEEADSTNLSSKINNYDNLQHVAKEMGNFQSAYNYLQSFNDIKLQLEEDTKRQKTAYLKIKFDSEQKEKENAILAAEIIEKQSQQKLLYGLIAFCSLFLIILFGALYQKRRYNKKLKVEVVKQTLNLKKSNEQLSIINKELDEFNRILSHDLREPLRSIVGFSQLASKEVKDSSKLSEYLNFVTKSGKQLSQLIQDVNIFRSTCDIATKKLEATNIQSIIDDTLPALRRKHHTKQIQLRSNELPSIFTDANIMKHVFRMLIDNAANYNTQEVVQINIHYRSEAQLHYFEIEDNGIGIAPQYHEAIFNMFKRLNNREYYPGTGLGLSLAQKLITKIDGKISVLRSQKDQGSTFLIQLPVSSETQEQPAEDYAYATH